MQPFGAHHAPHYTVQALCALGRIFGAATPLGALVSVRVSVLVANGSLDLAARAIVLQAFLCHLAIQDAATEFHCAGQMHRARDACAVGCHSLVSRDEIHQSQNRARWRAASSEAFALYVIIAECGRAPKAFQSVRISVRAVALCESFEPACRAKPSM